MLGGGGAANPFIRELFQAECLPLQLEVMRSDDLGLDSRFLECYAFACFAREFCAGRPVDLSAVTGSRHSVIMGTLTPAPSGAYVRGHGF